MSAERHVCNHCHRTPLTGERVHCYPGRQGIETVCDLCRPLRVGEPERSILVRSPEQSSVTPLQRRRDE